MGRHVHELSLILVYILIVRFLPIQLKRMHLIRFKLIQTGYMYNVRPFYVFTLATL